LLLSPAAARNLALVGNCRAQANDGLLMKTNKYRFPARHRHLDTFRKPSLLSLFPSLARGFA
jgi:hypothetical protein